MRIYFIQFDLETIDFLYIQWPMPTRMSTERLCEADADRMC